MANKLKDETSPYLLQHADNPVAWYPWSEEALQKARDEDRPIFLSIGYAACHWCHVMAHESFEDPAIAEILNEHFVNIKVDREERPDLDSIYMAAVVAMTRQGGWPMSVFLTPKGEPFWGGTYFPPTQRHGMPAFSQVILSIADAWQNRRSELLEGANEVTGHIQQRTSLSGDDSLLSPGLMERAVRQLENSFDRRMGGFGSAPKFPPSMTLEFLLRHHRQTRNKDALHMATHTLEMMAHGGMYDQIGGGFARYSTDANWLVPHFEKMLYDNGLLARVYLHAWQLTGNHLFKKVTEETLDWALKEMRHESGGFYSSLDADSEGEEGKFYVWQPDEIKEILGTDAELFNQYYDISERGNWEGESIPNVTRPLVEIATLAGLSEGEAAAQIEESKRLVYEHRAERIWPGRDEKVLTAWNGLLLSAMAEAGRVLDRPDYTEAATQNAEFLWDAMRQEDGRLLRSWKAGAGAKLNGYLEDYSYLLDGLLSLYQTTFEERWFHWAKEIADYILAHFTDSEAGGFFDTSDDHETLIHRPKEVQDNATPSGNAMAVTGLLNLSLLTGESSYWQQAEEAIAGLYAGMAQYSTAFGQWLAAAMLVIGEPQEIAIAGEIGATDTKALLAEAQKPYRPFQVVAVGNEGSDIPLLRGREQLDNKATAYVCRSFVCKLPVNSPVELRSLLETAET